jgi:LemA protein
MRIALLFAAPFGPGVTVYAEVWIVLFLAVVPLLWAILAFNALVRARNQVRAAFADVDVQLTKRHDLVPVLVESVRGYVAHERETLDDVVRLRGAAGKPRADADSEARENALAGAMGRLLALVEAYPDLKADGQFAQLMRELVAVEDALQYARRYYNGSVRDLNNRIQRFPGLLVARALGFTEQAFYEVARVEHRAAPQVSL